MTAPRPRVEGEAITSEQLLADATWAVDRFPETAKTLRRAAATIAALTAEVERLRGEKNHAIGVASDALHLAWGRLVFGHDDESEDNALQGRLAALALPTNAPEATDG